LLIKTSLFGNSSSEELSLTAEHSLLFDLTSQPTFKSMETFTFPFNADSEETKNIKNVTVYVITL